MLKIAFLGIPFLIGNATDFLQDGKVVADGIYRIAFIFRDEGLIVVDELFRQLSESQILDLVFGFDELPECQPHIDVYKRQDVNSRKNKGAITVKFELSPCFQS